MNPQHLRFIREEAALLPDPVAAEADMVGRYEAGEPLQYVLGTWDFRSHRLIVDRRVLIPRPETEQVVEAAIASVAHLSHVTALDLGTGSGAIAISLARELPATVHAVDASADALDVARLNGADTSITFHHGSWFDPLPSSLLGQFDLIVSNPPYVADADEVESVVSEWEPHTALFAGADGLEDIRFIISEAPKWLRPGGQLFIEIGDGQGAAVTSIARSTGLTSHIGLDLTGRERWLAASI